MSLQGNLYPPDSNYSNGAANWIISKAIPTASGVKWAINDNGTITYDMDLYSGSSGAGYFLLDAYLVTGNTEYLEYSQKAAREVRSRLSENTYLGFFDGRAGIGYFFASLYEATQEKEFLDDAEYVASQMESSYDANDIISGASGTGLFYLKLYKVTGKAAYLNSAKTAGDYLISNAISEGSGYKWTAGGGGDIIYTGFAHGVAGVAYYLAMLYQVSGDSKYLDYARGGANWLKEKAIADGNGYKWWRRSPDQLTEYNDKWCHGPAGIGLAFLKLYNITSDSSYLDYAKKGGNWIINTGDLSYMWNAGFCHGSASLGTYFVDLYKSTNDATNLNYSKEAAEFSKSIATKTSKGYNWTSGCLLTDDPTYNCGTGGIGDFFLYTQTRGKIGRLGEFDKKTPWAPELACLPKTIDTQITPVFFKGDGSDLDSYTSSQLGLQLAEKNGAKVYYKPNKKTLAEQLVEVSYKGLQLEYQLTNISLDPMTVVLIGSWQDLPGVSSNWINVDDDTWCLVIPTARDKLPLTMYNDSVSYNNMTAYMYYGLEFHEAVDVGLKHDLLGGSLGDISNRWFVEGQSDYLMFLASQAYGGADAVRSLIPYSLEKLVKLRQTQTTLDVIDENCWWTPSGDRKDTETACYESSAYVFSYLAEKYGPDITRKINNRLRTYQPSQIKSDLICSVIKDLTGEDITPLLRAVPLDDVIEYLDKGKLTNLCGSSTTTTTTSTSSTTTTLTTTTTTSTSSTTTSSTTTTTMPICSSTSSRTLVAGDNSIDFQTPHNYPDNMNCFSGIYRCPSGYKAKVYVKYDTEPIYDLLYVYDYDTGSLINVSANSSGFVWVTPSGYNAVRLRFVSDYSITYWGVDVDKVNCYVPGTTTTTSTSTTLASTTSTGVSSTTTTGSTSTTGSVSTTTTGVVSTTTTFVSSTTTNPPATTSTVTSTSTSSSGSSTTTASSTSTTVSWPCKMPGDYPPCGEVTIDELLNAIDLWTQGKMTMEEVLTLINAWAYGGYYFFT